jgi:hypothetical protein
VIKGDIDMRIVLASGAVALAGLLAACGESETAPKAETAPAADVAAAPAAETPTPPTYPAATGLADDKPALEIAEEALEGGFIKGGYHASALNNTNPTWGSHGYQGDTDTGVAKVTFDVPAGARRIGVPVSMGPTHDLLTLQVLDGNGAPVATLEPGAEDYKEWKLWEVTLPAAAQAKLSVEASDTGAEWGQWIAFGQPRVIE